MTLRELGQGLANWIEDLFQVIFWQVNWLDATIGKIFWALVFYGFVFWLWLILWNEFVEWNDKRIEHNDKMKNDPEYRAAHEARVAWEKEDERQKKANRTTLQKIFHWVSAIYLTLLFGSIALVLIMEAGMRMFR